MINITYAALHMRAQTEKMTFSCKDDCTLMKRTRHWTYSALWYFFKKNQGSKWADKANENNGEEDKLGEDKDKAEEENDKEDEVGEDNDKEDKAGDQKAGVNRVYEEKVKEEKDLNKEI